MKRFESRADSAGSLWVGVCVALWVVVPLGGRGQPVPTASAEEPLLTLQGQPEAMSPHFLDRVPPVADPATMRDLAPYFQDVPTSSPYANLSLQQCVQLAMDKNFTLVNARRDVDLAQSVLRQSEAFFIPFVELIGSAHYAESRTDVTDPLLLNTRRQRITTNSQSGRAEVTQNFATGGSVTVGGGPSRVRDGADSGPGNGTVTYENAADARFTQPLLQGGGFAAGTADLRLSRLVQMNQEITYRLQLRDTLFNVITQYFLMLQATQELRVNRDALAEKLRFLDETKIKYERGRVAESEILRAELQYLQEEENSVQRRQILSDRRERLALLLGLDPATPLSVQDVTDILAQRGRYEVPGVNESLTVGLNSRLELLQSELTYEQARVNLEVARNNVLPRLDVSTGYRTADQDRSLGGSTDLEDNTWDAGVELRIPLPNIAAREQRYRAGITVEKAKTDWDKTEFQVVQDIQASHRAVQASEAGLAILAKTVEQARKSLELVNGSFEVGYSTITEVRLSQDDLYDAQTRYNNTLLNYQLAIARYYVAVGQSLY